MISINAFYKINFNYNATLFALLMNDWKTIKVFDLEEEKEITEFSSEFIFNIVFNSSKSILAIAYEDHSITV